MRYLALLVLLAACDIPPMSIRFRLTDGDAQKCIGDTGVETTDCSAFTMICGGVASIRVVPPNDPDAPYISVCKPLIGAQNKLCAIAGVDLPPPTSPIPEQVLEVQIAVFREDQVPRDLNNDYVCPKVQFGADNLPVEAQEPCNPALDTCAVLPAVGGRAFYHPGDEKTVVELGCTYPELLNQGCKTEPDAVTLSAYVSDFDTQVSVSSNTADRLLVALGEPMFNPLTGGYDIAPNETVTPTRQTYDPPSWRIDVPLSRFDETVCLEALEDVPQATYAVTCTRFDPTATMIDITGYRVTRLTLSQILAALGRTTFPDQGLVVGVLLDPFLAPKAGETVYVDSGTVKYLSADRLSVTTDKTSSNGIFISEDAPYRAQFSWNGEVTALGGLLDRKVTVVVLKQPMIAN